MMEDVPTPAMALCFYRRLHQPLLSKTPSAIPEIPKRPSSSSPPHPSSNREKYEEFKCLAPALSVWTFRVSIQPMVH
ncbi:hypothetical protein SDJN03_11029, partial [Cucurbita argyrosperma subsp. sororia]